MRITAAGFVLLLLFGAYSSPAASAPDRLPMSWKVSMPSIGMEFAHQLSARGGVLALTERSGPIGGAPTIASRYELAFSAIGCVTAGRGGLVMYPAKRWNMRYTNLLTGKTSRGARMSLTFANRAQGQRVLRVLESQSPIIRKKLDACKRDVDLYALKFGTVPEKTDPYTWVRNSSLGVTEYAVWFRGGTVYEEETDRDIFRHAVKKTAVSGIGCVIADPGSKDLAPSLALVPRLPDDVLELESVGSRKPATLTVGAVSMTFDDAATQQAVLEYLKDRAPGLPGPIKASCR